MTLLDAYAVIGFLADEPIDEIAVDIAALGLESPAPPDATTSVLAGRLRARRHCAGHR